MFSLLMPFLFRLPPPSTSFPLFLSPLDSFSTLIQIIETKSINLNFSWRYREGTRCPECFDLFIPVITSSKQTASSTFFLCKTQRCLPNEFCVTYIFCFETPGGGVKSTRVIGLLIFQVSHFRVLKFVFDSYFIFSIGKGIAPVEFQSTKLLQYLLLGAPF